RAVFASQNIPSGTILDVSPVLILDPKENATHIEQTALYHYTYNWPIKDPTTGKATKTQAVVFGLGSMFNHSSQHQNVGWKRDLEREVVVYRALWDIDEGEELCISYGDRLTFVDVEGPPTDVIEEDTDAEEVLGRIELGPGVIA
ncbi:hypothetical protein LTR37_010473, partial [Vermiconidia calcicola]